MKFLKQLSALQGKPFVPHVPPSFEMVSLREALIDRSRVENETYFTERAKGQYLGNNQILCRILGDKKFFTIASDVGFSSHMIFDGFWEYWLTKHFAKKISPGDTVIDIGANLGYYTIISADLVTNTGRVVSVEPNPEVYGLLSKSISVNGYASHVEAHNFALSFGGEGGRRPFFVPTGEPKNGRFLDEHEDPEGLKSHGNVFDVEIGNLSVENFKRVDFIKIDVEGAELMVLRHIKPIIDKFKPHVVCEVNFGRGYSYEDVQSALGTSEPLKFLEYNSEIKILTKNMASTERVGDDWLVVYN